MPGTDAGPLTQGPRGVQEPFKLRRVMRDLLRDLLGLIQRGLEHLRGRLGFELRQLHGGHDQREAVIDVMAAVRQQPVERLDLFGSEMNASSGRTHATTMAGNQITTQAGLSRLIGPASRSLKSR